MPNFVNEGVSLYYEVHGSGLPVVMLHGAAVSFEGNYGACGWIDPLTARGLQVIGLDFRGHGSSDKPADAAPHGTEPLTRDVIALLDHLGIPQAEIVGYSIGSTVALHLLHTHPERFHAGALVATGDGIIGHPPLTFPTMLPPMVEILAWPELPADVPPSVAFYYHFAESVGGSRAGVAAALSGAYPPCSPEEAATDVRSWSSAAIKTSCSGRGRGSPKRSRAAVTSRSPVPTSSCSPSTRTFSARWPAS